MAKEIKINLARTGGILPDGVYKLRIKAIEFKEGQKAPYFAVQLSVEGRTATVFDNVSTAENARFRMEPFLDAIEAPASGNLTAKGIIKLATRKVVYAKLGNEDYNGRLKNTIAAYLKAEDGERLMAEQVAPEEEELIDAEDIEEEDEDGDGFDVDDDDATDDDDGDEGSGPNLPF